MVSKGGRPLALGLGRRKAQKFLAARRANGEAAKIFCTRHPFGSGCNLMCVRSGRLAGAERCGDFLKPRVTLDGFG